MRFAKGRTAQPRPIASAPLGVGLSYLPGLPESFWRSGGPEFVEITPETLCQARREDGRVRLDVDPARLDRARRTCDGLPIVVHGVELSIGSAHGMNHSYLEMLDEFEHAWPFRWHSEHLSFQTVRDDDGNDRDVGIPLPLPATEEAIALVGGRARGIAARYAVPFLLENPAHYLAELPTDPGVDDEFGLMNRVLDVAGCGQLLDLHNLYCNAVNFGFDPLDALGRLGLERVVEIHLAGGSWRDGFLTDGHDGRVPEPVWDMLDQVLARPSAIAGVVFELLDDHVGAFGATMIEGEIDRARTAWSRRANRRLAEVD